jgi:methionine sulfoxide reductase heme-binding subunit
MTTWIVLRAAGVASYLLLFASVAWGLVATTALFGRRPHRATSTSFHQFLGTAGLTMLMIHLGGLLVDRFMPFGVADILVPMRSGYRPFAVALGILSMYLVGVVVVTSWAKKRVGTKWWRRAHILAAPAFALALVHGVLAGSDTGHPAMQAMYVSTGLITVFLLLVRGLTARRPPVVDKGGVPKAQGHAALTRSRRAA